MWFPMRRTRLALTSMSRLPTFVMSAELSSRSSLSRSSPIRFFNRRSLARLPAQSNPTPRTCPLRRNPSSEPCRGSVMYEQAFLMRQDRSGLDYYFTSQPKTKLVIACLLLLLIPAALAAQHPVVFISYRDAQPMLQAEAEILPQGLAGQTQDALARDWPGWIARQDTEIRTRLAQGDEDSLINFLVFGTSYTRQPRISTAQLARLSQISDERRPEPQNASLVNTLKARIGDLIKNVLAPGANERLLFARQVLVVRKGFNLNTAGRRALAERFLLYAPKRVLREHAPFVKGLGGAQHQGRPSVEVTVRARGLR